MDKNFLLNGVMYLIPLLLSLTVHEFAHAWSAWKLGDDTAERAGRLTLNPLAHMDPIGTLLLPMLGIPFGWAKPVPVNPVRFTRRFSMRSGMMITASAGPISNVILAVLVTLIIGVLYRFSPGFLDNNPGVLDLLARLMQINVVLALFNMIPVPPLDGSRLVDGLMPQRFRPTWEGFTRFAPFLLLGVMFYGGDIIRGPANHAFHLLQRLLVAVAM